MGWVFFALRDAERIEEARVEARRFLALVRAGRAACGDDLRDDYDRFTSSAM